ncbi:hypothetical protein BB934_07605 [Microvirga ossetica]|uniref:Uncharacterized protein n=2 Tax=Microvirga ossetica TaxID=1882682 RepID=A0A1B2EDT3_9HYPH|nr:hypothetical protein BB934_07605 [Microvirga ossetica]
MSFDPNDPQLRAFITNAIAAALQGQAQMFAQTQAAQIPAPAQIPAQFETDTCPAIDDITLLQATFFDNWPDGAKVKNSHRYKMTLEVWTDDAEDIRLSEWSFKRSVVLIEYWQMESRLTKLLARKSISQEYHDELMQVWKNALPPLNSPKLLWFGLIGDKGTMDGKKGTNYYDRQFIMVEMENGHPNFMILSVNGELLSLEAFATTDMKGNPFKAPVKYQGRLDLCEYRDAWGTT